MGTVSAEKNSINYNITTTKTTVPAYLTKTGTIVTSGKNVVGTGTLFVSEVRPGDWIADINNFDELRKVKSITDNTHLTIDSPFAGDILAANPLRTIKSRAKLVSLSNTGGSDATVDGTPLIPGETVSFPKSNKNPNGSDFIDPFIVVPASTTVHVLIQK